MITVVVPVLNNINITDEFFMTIYNNTVIPNEIILFDNGSTDDYPSLVKKYKQLNINYIKKSKNVGVNIAWNEGIRISKNPYVSILNNDLLLNRFFFEKVIESMESIKDLGIVVPTIVKNKKDIRKSLNEPVKLIKIRKREGCAFTIRKELNKRIKPIPVDELKTYCGDDYLFYFTELIGFKIRKMSNNFVFHYGSKTVLKVWSDKKTTRVKEKQIWKKIRGVKDEMFVIKSKSNRKI